jgi:hypothetical protein
MMMWIDVSDDHRGGDREITTYPPLSCPRCGRSWPDPPAPIVWHECQARTLRRVVPMPEGDWPSFEEARAAVWAGFGTA